jgi:hypothetical protein
MADLLASFVTLSLFSALWVVLLWIGGAFLAAWVASEKNRDPVGWWFLGFFLSPLLVLVALNAVPARRSEPADERDRTPDPAVTRTPPIAPEARWRRAGQSL